MRTTMLACLLLLTPIVSASAQDAPESSATPESSADAEARSIFDAARTAFNNGRYEEALEYFTRAYELSGRPELLYNLGQTLDRLDREAEALDHYRRFLVELPDTEMRGQAEGRIRIIEERLAAAEAAEAAAAAEVEAPRPAAFDPTGPAVLYATSGAALVVGVVLGALALDHRSQLDAMCPGGFCDPSLRGYASEMDGFSLGADITLAASLGLATIATIVLAVTASSTSDAPVACGPSGCALRF
jgi:tetratricopeptide (TPR) repeat protein